MTLETEHPDLAGLARSARQQPGSLLQMMMVANDDDGLMDLAEGGLRRELRRLHRAGEPARPIWREPGVWIVAAAAAIVAGLTYWQLT